MCLLSILFGLGSNYDEDEDDDLDLDEMILLDELDEDDE